MEGPEIYVGKTVKVVLPTDMAKEDLITLHRLNHIVTVADLDIIQGKVYGFYSEELEGYLFTPDQVTKI